MNGTPDTDPDSSAQDRGPAAAHTPSEHYFTASPASPQQLRTISVALAGAPRAVTVAGGIFSPDGVDRGSAVLLAHAPEPPRQGTFLDLGCGWGPLALTLALRSPESDIWALDVNERALDLMRRNAIALALPRIRAVRAEQVPASARFDLIWSNPPIRIGKAALHGLLRTWLPRLAPGGRAYLVVAKQLGADSLHRWLAAEWPHWTVTRIATDKGFRVLEIAA